MDLRVNQFTGTRRDFLHLVVWLILSRKSHTTRCVTCAPVGKILIFLPFEWPPFSPDPAFLPAFGRGSTVVAVNVSEWLQWVEPPRSAARCGKVRSPPSAALVSA